MRSKPHKRKKTFTILVAKTQSWIPNVILRKSADFKNNSIQIHKKLNANRFIVVSEISNIYFEIIRIGLNARLQLYLWEELCIRYSYKDDNDMYI